MLFDPVLVLEGHLLINQVIFNLSLIPIEHLFKLLIVFNPGHVLLGGLAVIFMMLLNRLIPNSHTFLFNLQPPWLLELTHSSNSLLLYHVNLPLSLPLLFLVPLIYFLLNLLFLQQLIQLFLLVLVGNSEDID